MTLALVLGSAASVWQDAAAALRLATPDTVIAVNDMIRLWPRPIDHAVTLHPAKLPLWTDARRDRGLPMGFKVWSHAAAQGVDSATADWKGSSGLLAVKVALFKLHHDGVICAGVPLTLTPHVGQTNPWLSWSTFVDGWRTHLPDIRPRARSMSGWTRDRLGEPSALWLLSIKAKPPDPRFIAEIEEQGRLP